MTKASKPRPCTICGNEHGAKCPAMSKATKPSQNIIYGTFAGKPARMLVEKPAGKAKVRPDRYEWQDLATDGCCLWDSVRGKYVAEVERVQGAYRVKITLGYYLTRDGAIKQAESALRKGRR